MYSAHYNQILVNLSVKDNAPEQVLEDLKTAIERTLKENADPAVIKDYQVKIN